MKLPPLTRGTLIRRYKRFLADVRLDDGREVTAHCANPGRMTSCLGEGWPVWLSWHGHTKRKLKWSWELTRNPEQAWILINTARPNHVVREGIAAGRVEGLSGEIQREVKTGDSRIDLVVGEALVEVKSVTLMHAPGQASFPDAPTERGRKHLAELAKAARSGRRAVLFWMLSRDDCRSVRPAGWVDPAYERLLRSAVGDGVEVLAYRMVLSEEELTLGQQVPAILD
ncbi:MAG TPA: DNA/RNA nuclease SfsA [Myxococcota bacterium]|nr:DNA/RNA nuclease SfsA [Myxococcota bacterium]